MLPLLALVATLALSPAHARPLTHNDKRISIIPNYLPSDSWTSWGTGNSIAPGLFGDGSECDVLNERNRCSGPTHQMVQICVNGKWVNFANCLAPGAPGTTCSPELGGTDVLCTDQPYEGQAQADAELMWDLTRNIQPKIWDHIWWSNGTHFRQGTWPGKLYHILTDATESAAATSASTKTGEAPTATTTTDPNVGYVGNGFKFTAPIEPSASASSTALTTADAGPDGWGLLGPPAFYSVPPASESDKSFAPLTSAPASSTSSSTRKYSWTVHYRSTTTLAPSTSQATQAVVPALPNVMGADSPTTSSASNTAQAVVPPVPNVLAKVINATESSSASASASFNASSTLLNPSTAAAKPTGIVAPATSISSPRFTTPHHVIYSDMWFKSGHFPTSAELGAFNRLILHVYMSPDGAWDNVRQWVNMSDEERDTVLEDYHNHRIALMLSLFGAMDAPTTEGVDPVAFAKEVAAFTKKFRFDGVDVDYEDFVAINAGKSSAWVISLTHTLRAELGPDYLISHAPTAPMFDPSQALDGGYATVHKEAGSEIDFYNIQYYNQGKDQYVDCESIVNDSGPMFPGTALLQLVEAGIPANKLVLGKPVSPEQSTIGGYMAANALGKCAKEASAIGVDSVMFWQWNDKVDSAAFLDSVLDSTSGAKVNPTSEDVQGGDEDDDEFGECEEGE